MELDVILKVMLESLDALSSFPLFLKGGKKVGWHVFCVTSKKAKLVRGFVKEVWALTKFRHIQRLQSFLEKVATSMKVVTSSVENDTMIHFKGVSFTKMFFLNLSFLPYVSLGRRIVRFWTSEPPRFWAKSEQIARLRHLSRKLLNSGTALKTVIKR